MTTCPDCGHENFPGAEECEGCQQSLSQLFRTTPPPGIERSIIKDRIERLPPRQAILVEADSPVGQVLETMVENSSGCVLVIEEGRLAGIFTERDALLKLGADAPSMAARPVAEFMTPGPETLRATDKIAFALHKMDLGGYRHIPILDEEGQIAGIVSIRDILRYVTEQLVATA